MRLGMWISITVLTLLLFSRAGWAADANDWVGTWELVSGTYDGSVIANLNATLWFVSGSSYQAHFENGTDVGDVRKGAYELIDGTFQSNADDGFIKLDGKNFGYACCPYQTTWRTDIVAHNEAFNQWGATALGFNDPLIDQVGDQIFLTSTDGKADLIYQKVSDSIDLVIQHHVSQISLSRTRHYGGEGDSLAYQFDADLVVSSDVNSVVMVVPGGDQYELKLVATPGGSNFHYHEESSLSSELDQFMAGEYQFWITTTDGHAGGTTVSYQTAEGTPLSPVTQQPQLIYPTPVATDVPINVVFVFTAPSDPNWTTDLQWGPALGGALAGQAIGLTATESTYGPVTLQPGTPYRLIMMIKNARQGDNSDGISYHIAMSAEAEAVFTTKGTVSIPDQALMAAVQSVLDVNIIFTDDLLRLTQLDLPDAGVQDLTGLEAAANLETLNLAGNGIVDVTPLSGLTHLKTLGLSDNQIVDLSSLAGLTALEELGLKNNQIKDLQPLQDLTSLKRLNAAGNQIEDVTALQGLIRLEVLRLNNNKITNVHPLLGLNHLVYLDLLNNSLAVEACTDIAALRSMIAGTLLTDLSCSN